MVEIISYYILGFSFLLYFFINRIVLLLLFIFSVLYVSIMSVVFGVIFTVVILYTLYIYIYIRIINKFKCISKYLFIMSIYGKYTLNSSTRMYIFEKICHHVKYTFLF